MPFDRVLAVASIFSLVSPAVVAQSLNTALTDPAEIVAVCGGDLEAGAALFAAGCAACHAVQSEVTGQPLLGPSLHAVFGRRIGAAEGFGYSQALLTRGGDGTVWERDTLHAWLGDPQAFAPGAAPHPVLASSTEIQNLLTHLRVVSQPPPPPRGSVMVPAEVLAQEGDAEYGAFLASECAGCHQAAGGIAPIEGLPRADFLTAMFEYRLGARENSTMRNIAGQLDDEALVALAAYFEQGR